MGVIYDPIKDELFVAEKGKGAYVHGKRMGVSEEKTLRESLIATGLPTDQQYALPLNLKEIACIAPEVRNLRIAGSAALHMAYVAAGRLTGFWEIGLNSWDLAAGALLVKESGGTVTSTQGESYTLGVRNIMVTNGHIHDELLHALAKADTKE